MMDENSPKPATVSKAQRTAERADATTPREHLKQQTASTFFAVVSALVAMLANVVAAASSVRELTDSLRRVVVPAIVAVTLLSLGVFGMYAYIVRGRRSAQRLAEVRRLLKRAYSQGLVLARFQPPSGMDRL